MDSSLVAVRVHMAALKDTQNYYAGPRYWRPGNSAAAQYTGIDRALRTRLLASLRVRVNSWRCLKVQGSHCIDGDLGAYSCEASAAPACRSSSGAGETRLSMYTVVLKHAQRCSPTLFNQRASPAF